MSSTELRGLGGMTPPLDRSGTPSQNPYSDPSLMESDADKSFSQSTLQQTSQKQLTSNDATIMQREREITDIAKGIIELADIFKDLQTMVIDQGTMLDRIDYNVERMAVDVKGADKELVVVSDSIHFHITPFPNTSRPRPQAINEGARNAKFSCFFSFSSLACSSSYSSSQNGTARPANLPNKQQHL